MKLLTFIACVCLCFYIGFIKPSDDNIRPEINNANSSRLVNETNIDNQAEIILSIDSIGITPKKQSIIN